MSVDGRLVMEGLYLIALDKAAQWLGDATVTGIIVMEVRRHVLLIIHQSLCIYIYVCLKTDNNLPYVQYWYIYSLYIIRTRENHKDNKLSCTNGDTSFPYLTYRTASIGWVGKTWPFHVHQSGALLSWLPTVPAIINTAKSDNCPL